MEKLSPEAQAIYELLEAETEEAYEARFLDYKKEALDAVRKFVADTGKQIKTVSAAVGEVRSSVTSNLEAAKSFINADLEAVKETLTSEIAAVASSITRIPRPDPGASTDRSSASRGKDTVDVDSPDGHRSEPFHRGTTSTFHSSPLHGVSSSEWQQHGSRRSCSSHRILRGQILSQRYRLASAEVNIRSWYTARSTTPKSQQWRIML